MAAAFVLHPIGTYTAIAVRDSSQLFRPPRAENRRLAQGDCVVTAACSRDSRGTKGTGAVN